MANCCVICYKVGHPPSERDSSNNDEQGGRISTKVKAEDSQRFFQLLERYLCEGKGAEGADGIGIPGAGRNKNRKRFPLEMMMAKIGMTCCRDCLQVTGSFCELYHEREKIELLLKWKVWTLKNLMGCAQKVPSRIRDFREKVRQLGEVEGINGLCADEMIDLVLESKTALIERCSSKLLNSYPKLSIPKWQSQDSVVGIYLEDQPQQKGDVGNGMGVESSDGQDATVENFFGEDEGLPLVESSKPELVDQLEADSQSRSISHVDKASSNGFPVVKIEMDDESDRDESDISSFEEEDDARIQKAEADDDDEENTALNKTEQGSTSDHRFLRTVHCCDSCSKTFSSNERLRNHQKEGCRRCENAEADPVEDGDFWNAENDTDTTGTSDGDSDDAFVGEDSGAEAESEAYMDEDNLGAADDLDQHHQKKKTGTSTSVAAAGEEKTQLLKCSVCTNEFKNKGGLHSHLLSKHPLKWKKLKKSIKDAKTAERGAWNEGTKRFNFKCPDCSKLYIRLDSLLLHRKESHQQKISIVEADSKKITVEILPSSGTSLDKTKDFKTFAKVKVVDKIFVCPLRPCHQSLFYFSEDLAAHSKLHGKFKCSFCDVVKEYAPELSEHELEHHAGNGRPTNRSSCRCSRCQLGFPNKDKYLRHHLTSHLHLPFVEANKCGICGSCRVVNGNKSRELIKHYKLQHDLTEADPESIKFCKMKNCSGYFLTQSKLTIHMARRHKIGVKNQERLKCKNCSKTFKNSLCLRNHRRKLHPVTSTQFQCSFAKCTVVCESQEELENHKRYRHSSSKMDFVECPKCKKLLNGTGTFKIHMKAHERKEQTSATGLIHTPTRAFVCELCGKVFKAKTHLDLHYLSHSGPESWEFTCGVCSKKCMTKQKLDEHMRTHTKEKPYVCEICGQTYAYRNSLRAHVSSTHGDGDVAEENDKSTRQRKSDPTKSVPSKKLKGTQRKRKRSAVSETENSSDTD